MRLSLDSFTCSQAFYPAFLLSHAISCSSTILYRHFFYCFNKHHHFCKNTTTQCWESIHSRESIAFPSFRAPNKNLQVLSLKPPGKLALKWEVSPHSPLQGPNLQGQQPGGSGGGAPWAPISIFFRHKGGWPPNSLSWPEHAILARADATEGLEMANLLEPPFN